MISSGNTHDVSLLSSKNESAEGTFCIHNNPTVIVSVNLKFSSEVTAAPNLDWFACLSESDYFIIRFSTVTVPRLTVRLSLIVAYSGFNVKSLQYPPCSVTVLS